MSSELLLHVFDRFHQGDSSSSKSSHGLGLGLSIVRHIVELHSGTVRAESAGEGQGTTLIIELPLDLTPDRTPIVVEPIKLPTQDVSVLAGLQLLVVDDERDILDLIEYILETAGAEVTITGSAKEAIAALRASDGKYDALLADIGMPEEDGFELIRQVRALPVAVGGQIPAAAITAYVSERERQRTIDAGFQVHLAKPIYPDQLIQMVANLTEQVKNKQ
jgi:two-component system, chemotaxis family, CheB/CheR fusion protein